MVFTDMPTLAVNVDSPSAGAALGYLVFNDATYGKFNTAKFAPSAIYVDKVTSARHVAIRRGSNDETAALWHAQTGQASVTFDNRTRTFDPNVNADIRPHRGLQITATWDSVVYNLFTGFVDEWPLDYPAYGKDATTTVRALDGTSLLVDLDITDPLPRALSGARIDELLDLTAWPAALRNISTGSTRMPASLRTVAGVQAMIEAADSEMAELYVETDGTMTFRDRTAIVSEARSVTSQATFGDAGGAELPYSDISLSYDSRRIRNFIAVAYNERGDVAYASDAISINRYGRKSFSLQVSIESETTARGLAAFLLLLYKEPLIRVDGLVLKPRAAPATLWPQALGRRLSDRVTVKVTPPGGGARIQRDVFIRSIGHEITPNGEWTTTFGFQDASSYGSYFKFNTSTFNGSDRLWF